MKAGIGGGVTGNRGRDPDMSSHSQHAWTLRAFQADSYHDLNCVMDDWYETVKADRRLMSSIGFESYMKARDWQGAKGSVERSFGRSSPEHRSALEMLYAAIQNRAHMKC